MTAGHQEPAAGVTRDDPPTSEGLRDQKVKALARSRELRARSRRLRARCKCLDRAAAAHRPAAASHEPQAGARNTGRPSGRQPPGLTADLDEQVRHAKAPRVRLAALAADLAETEESVAHAHDQLAIKDPKNAVQYGRTADAARQAARHLREFLRNTTENATRGG
jgi:hypothetical protein